MSAEQLATRIIAEQSGIPSSTIRRGGINERDFEKIKDVAVELQHLPFFIDETGVLRGSDHAGAPATAADDPIR